MIACSAGNTQIAQALINKDASVLVSNNSGQTCLHYAASKDRKEICTLLLESGADINAQDNVLNTALHRAASKGNTPIVELFLKWPGVDVNLVDSMGNTPL